MLPAPPRCECRDKPPLSLAKECIEATYTGRVGIAAAVVAFANNVARYIPGSVSMVMFFGHGGIGSLLLEQRMDNVTALFVDYWKTYTFSSRPMLPWPCGKTSQL